MRDKKRTLMGQLEDMARFLAAEIIIAVLYLAALVLSFPIISFLIRGLIVFSAWIKNLLLDLSIRSANFHADWEAKRLFSESVASQILEPMATAVFVWLLLVVIRMFSGSWLHE